MMTEIDVPMVSLTALDRCDRCGAQAYSMATHEDMPQSLLFCIHHRRENFEGLTAKGWTVVDDYEALGDLAGNESVVY